MEERKIKVLKKDVGYGEEHYLGGYASYKRVVDRFIGNNLVLCNNIINVDNELFYNRECGFADYDDLKEERLEELKEEYKEELENGEETLEHLEELAEDYAEEEQYDYEFYQYFIIDISNWDLEYLKECKQTTLQIMYSELLDVYVLGVGHFGTGRDYVGSDFKLEIVGE